MWHSGRLKPAGWDTIGLMNLGYTFDYIENVSLKELDFEDLKQRKYRAWAEYLKTVAQQENIVFDRVYTAYT